MRELVEESLDRARLTVDGGAFTHLDTRGARECSEPGRRPSGPLERFVVAVKDIMSVAGVPLTAGSAVRRSAEPERNDASVVSALRRHGAIVLGTVALHEFAFGVTGVNHLLGAPPNPHDAGRLPGGSSSGSAVAVAEGSARLAVGTDTGGSVRIPAAFCGVVGFKPSFGTYPTDGVFPLAPTLDHLGLLARTMPDIVAAHRVLGGEATEPRRPDTIGVDIRAMETATPEVAAAVESALTAFERAGCRLVDFEWPSTTDVFELSTTILFAEAAAVHREDLARCPDRYGADVHARLTAGSAISATEYLTARWHQPHVGRDAANAVGSVSAVLGPTVATTAPTAAEAAADPTLPSLLVANTRLANLTGLPAMSLPVPTSGMPVGAQVISSDDQATIAAAWFLEQVLR